MGATCSKDSSVTTGNFDDEGGAPAPHNIEFPSNLPKRLTEWSEDPSSTFSLLRGQTDVLAIIDSYSISPCSCNKDQGYSCRNHKFDELPTSLKKKFQNTSAIDSAPGKEETILAWAVGVRSISYHCAGASWLTERPEDRISIDSRKNGWTRADAYEEEGVGTSSSPIECETYMVVTSSGFYSEFLNFRWTQQSTRTQKHNNNKNFSGFLVGSGVPTMSDDPEFGSCNPEKGLRFLKKVTWKERRGLLDRQETGARGWRQHNLFFTTGNPELNKQFYKAVQNQLRLHYPEEESYKQDADVGLKDAHTNDYVPRSKYPPAEPDEEAFALCLE